MSSQISPQSVSSEDERGKIEEEIRREFEQKLEAEKKKFAEQVSDQKQFFDSEREQLKTWAQEMIVAERKRFQDYCNQVEQEKKLNTNNTKPISPSPSPSLSLSMQTETKLREIVLKLKKECEDKEIECTKRDEKGSPDQKKMHELAELNNKFATAKSNFSFYIAGALKLSENCELTSKQNIANFNSLQQELSDATYKKILALSNSYTEKSRVCTERSQPNCDFLS